MQRAMRCRRCGRDGIDGKWPVQIGENERAGLCYRGSMPARHSFLDIGTGFSSQVEDERLKAFLARPRKAIMI